MFVFIRKNIVIAHDKLEVQHIIPKKIDILELFDYKNVYKNTNLFELFKDPSLILKRNEKLEKVLKMFLSVKLLLSFSENNQNSFSNLKVKKMKKLKKLIFKMLKTEFYEDNELRKMKELVLNDPYAYFELYKSDMATFTFLNHKCKLKLPSLIDFNTFQSFEQKLKLLKDSSRNEHEYIEKLRKYFYLSEFFDSISKNKNIMFFFEVYSNLIYLGHYTDDDNPIKSHIYKYENTLDQIFKDKIEENVTFNHFSYPEMKLLNGFDKNINKKYDYTIDKNVFKTLNERGILFYVNKKQERNGTISN